MTGNFKKPTSLREGVVVSVTAAQDYETAYANRGFSDPENVEKLSPEMVIAFGTRAAEAKASGDGIDVISGANGDDTPEEVEVSDKD